MNERMEMGLDSIAEVGIDKQRRLYVKPCTATFPRIFSEGVGVHWEPASHHLHSLKPGIWPYLRWFQHLIGAAASQSCSLHLTPSTIWINIDAALEDDMRQWLLLRT